MAAANKYYFSDQPSSSTSPKALRPAQICSRQLLELEKSEVVPETRFAYVSRHRRELPLTDLQTAMVCNKDSVVTTHSFRQSFMKV